MLRYGHNSNKSGDIFAQGLSPKWRAVLNYGNRSNKSGDAFCKTCREKKRRDLVHPRNNSYKSDVFLQYLISDGKQVGVHRGETEQMNSRLMYINLGSGLEREAVVECPPCLHCAAELYSEGCLLFNGSLAAVRASLQKVCLHACVGQPFASTWFEPHTVPHMFDFVAICKNCRHCRTKKSLRFQISSVT